MREKETVRKQLVDEGVITIIRAPSSEAIMDIARALAAGGAHAVEITMTVPGAIEALRGVAKEMGDELLLGVGTVLDAETAKAAVEAGAQYVVAPCFDAPTVEWCRKNDVTVCPGCFTATEIVTAWRAGADFVKVFPTSVGGPGLIKALRGPLPQVPMIATGGVSDKTAGEFIRAGAVALGVGSWLVDKKSIAEGNWAEITRKAKVLLDEVRKARAEMKK